MVQVLERAVGPDDVSVTIYSRSELWRYPASGYQRVPERTWAKLDAKSPVSGLCADSVDTSLVFVFHCDSTRRTALMHTPSMVDMQPIIDQLEYLANGSSVPVEMVVLKGAIFSDQRRWELAEDIQRCAEDDLAWVDQFVNDIRAHAKKQSLPLTVTRPARCLEHGCVLVDKNTGEITIPVPASGFEAKHLHVGLSEPMPESRFLQLAAEGLFYRITSTAHAIALQQFGFLFAYPCYLQYDGMDPMPSLRMPDFARTIFQYFVLYGLIPSGVSIPVSEKLSVTVSEELRAYINTYPLRDQGMFCEVCRKPTKSTCNSCRTAWYCCRDHQTSDWKYHRVWCKTHRVISAAPTPHRRSSGESQSSMQTAQVNTPKKEVDTTKRTEENESRLTNGDSLGAQVQTPSIGEKPAIEPSTTDAKVEREEVKTFEEDSTSNASEPAGSDNSLPEEKTNGFRVPQPILYKVRSELSLVLVREADAMLRKNLKSFVTLLSSWKFYFCLAFVLVAYLARIYHVDADVNYSVAW